MVELEEAKQKIDKAIEYYEGEVNRLRGGRVSPAILEGIEIDAYGSKTPIAHVGNITVVDANLLVVTVWDKSLVEEVKKGIESSDLGINPVIEGEMVKLPIPPMSEERRLEIVKLLHEKSEDAKVVIRQIRKEYIGRIDRQLKEKEISEDKAERQKKEIQKIVDESNDKIEKITKAKEEDLMSI